MRIIRKFGYLISFWLLFFNIQAANIEADTAFVDRFTSDAIGKAIALNPDSLLKEAQLTLSTFEKDEYPEKQLVLLGILTTLNYNKEDIAESNRYLNEMLDRYGRISSKKEKIIGAGHLVITYCNTNKLKEALIYYNLFYPSILDYNQLSWFHSVNNTIAGKLNQNRRSREAIPLLKQCIQELDSTKNKNWLANDLNSLGLCYWNTGDNDKALSIFKKTYQLFEQENDSVGLMHVTNNIGNVLTDLGELDQALEFHKESKHFAEQLYNKWSIVTSYINIGVVNGRKYNEFISDTTKYSREDAVNVASKALDYYLKGMQIAHDFQQYDNEILCLNNAGAVLLDMSSFVGKSPNYKLTQDFGIPWNSNMLLDSAESLILRSKELIDKYQIHYSTGYVIYNMACIEMERGNFKSAIEQFEKLADFALERDETNLYYTANANIATCYEALGNYSEALKHQKIVSAYKDTLFQADKRTEIGKLQAEIEYEKELSENRRAKAIAEKEKETRNIIIVLIGILTTLIVVFAAFLAKRLKITRKQNEIIHDQKQLVDQKNKMITNSISYARRIQQAILPGEKLFEGIAGISGYIYYQPKDIVSGDFYWTYALPDNKGVLFCLADCTGHGVPGAFMSMLGSTMLDQIVMQNKEFAPNKILDELNRMIIEKLSKNNDNKDGMDIVVGNINFQNKVLSYSGAINSIFIVRDGKSEELKTDKVWIGHENFKQHQFSVQEFNLEDGDMIYSASDGFQDQSGGEKGKKYYKKRFVQYLVTISNQSLEEQAKSLSTEFNQWLGDGEQKDDVCVMGLKVQ